MVRFHEEADSTDPFLELPSEGRGMEEPEWSKWQNSLPKFAWKELAEKGNSIKEMH